MLHHTSENQKACQPWCRKHSYDNWLLQAEDWLVVLVDWRQWDKPIIQSLNFILVWPIKLNPILHASQHINFDSLAMTYTQSNAALWVTNIITLNPVNLRSLLTWGQILIQRAQLGIAPSAVCADYKNCHSSWRTHENLVVWCLLSADKLNSSINAQ